MKLKMYRQGDILIEEIAALPKGLTKQKPENGRIILARGEVTGHHHSLTADAADWWKNDSGDQYLTVTEPSPVEHQEHGVIPLEQKHYRIIRQREYAPEAIRNVMD